MTYAIVDIGGNQIFVEPKKFYDIDYIPSNPGDLICLKRVLFLSNSYTFQVGTPCINNILVKATILRHFKSKKVAVFKMKSKKNYRVKRGHRQKFTRIFIEDINI
uniref:Large ribosomal subunit protein bL21c n=1 Tax=Polysiphonia sp. TaxID=1967842 RepID=A0A1Z1MU78_9FLOR|nr:ribosomal protein L21 [Polysiphonia sp.]